MVKNPAFVLNVRKIAYVITVLLLDQLSSSICQMKELTILYIKTFVLKAYLIYEICMQVFGKGTGSNEARFVTWILIYEKARIIYFKHKHPAVVEATMMAP